MAAVVPPLNHRRVMPLNQVINIFMDDLFRGAFNHHSDYIRDSLENDWRIQEMIADHNIDEDHECLRFVIVCAFLLGRYDVITALLERNEIDFDEELFYVKIDCLPDLLDYLISEKLCFDYRRILRISCSNGNLKLIRHIVEKLGYKPRENFIYITEAKDHPDVIRYFLSELRFNVNKIQEHDGTSYLFHFVQVRRSKADNLEAIKVLLEFGIDITIRNREGLLAVDVIRRSSHSEAIRGLIENYHDPLSVKEPEGEMEGESNEPEGESEE